MKIVTTIEAHYNDGINCYKCSNRYSKYKEELREKRTNAFKKASGCFDLTTTAYTIGIDKTTRSIRYKGCPGNYTSLSVNYFIDLFSKYEKGVLPFKGTLGDQPSKIIEVFQLISDKFYQKRKEQEDKDSRKNKNG